MKIIWRIFFVTFILLFQTKDIFSIFKTIDDVRIYLDTIEEYPDVTMRDWSNPNYIDYYKKIRSNFFYNFLEKIGLYKPIFSPLQAKKLLKSITRRRELDGYGERFIQKIMLQKNDKILIFGDICGALHSFVRDLEYLKNTNVLSNDFKLKDGYYMIINGNVTDKSHHLLELLGIIIRLLQENQKKVFYIRGSAEDKEGWLGKTLEYELIARARHVSSGRVPLETEINRFFNTLPLAVFGTMVIEGEIQYIRFSAEGLTQKELHAESIKLFLQSEIKQNFHKLNETIVFNSEYQKKTNFVALFRLEDRRKTYRTNKGILQLDDEEGISTFATMSGPVEAHRRLYSFFYDSFIEINIGDNFMRSTLTNFFRDVRETQGFQQNQIPFLFKTFVSQQENKTESITETVTPKETTIPDDSKIKRQLKLGCTLDLTRALARVGEQHRKGIKAAIKRYEREHEMNVQITFLDDQYTPEIARSNIENLLSKKIDIILGPIGSPTTEQYLDLIKEKKVLVLFPMTGASLFRNQEIPYIFNFRASYETEAQILLHEAINTHHAEKVVLFYQDDSFGRAALVGIEKYEKAKAIKNDFVIRVPYERNNVNFATQSETIKKSNPQVIILVTVVSAARELLRLFDMSFFSGKVVLGVSDLSEQTFINFSKEKGINIQTISVTPSPHGEIEIAKRFREDASSQHIDMDTFSFEGYIDATICLDALKQIKGEQDIKEALKNVLSSYKNYNLFGLSLTFNPEKQDLSQGTWWVSDEKEWLSTKIPMLEAKKTE